MQLEKVGYSFQILNHFSVNPAVEDQLSWLKEAGFTDIDYVYKYFNFAVFYAKKQ